MNNKRKCYRSGCYSYVIIKFDETINNEFTEQKML